SLSGVLIPFIVDDIGPRHLLVFSEVSVALCVAVTFAVDREPRGLASSTSAEQPDRRSLRALARDRYLALFFGASVISYGIYFLVDYNYYDAVHQRFTDDTDLASFFGGYFAVMNTVSLVLNGLVVGRVLTRYGIGVALIVLPVFVGLGGVATLLLPALRL